MFRKRPKGCKDCIWGDGYGSVGIAVAPDTRGPQFKTGNWPNLYLTLVYCQLY